MNPEQLLNNFENVIEAPDTVPRLRRFILDLAVRGKLVAQDPNDEPASVLLERIQTVKARLVGAGKLRNAKTALPVTDGEPPFLLPDSWLWVRLGDLFAYDAGVKTEPHRLPKDAWLLELEDIEKDSGRIIRRLTVSARAPKSTKSGFQPGDVLYGKLRPYLNKAVVADQPGFSTTEIVVLRCYGVLPPRYTVLALRRPDFVDYVTKCGQGTKMPRLRTEDAIKAVFPLPPLTEQYRIVAKVDELMALCDELAAAQATRESQRDRLVGATLHRLNNGDGPTFKENARFYFNHLPRLTMRPEHIKQLRQTILNLAVRGKLVAQDPNDEPAAELVKRIAVEKIRLVSAGEIRKVKPALVIVDDEMPFKIPEEWEFVRLGNISTLITKGSTPTSYGRSFERQGINFVKVESIKAGVLQPENINSYISQETHEFLKRSQLRESDFLFSIAGSIGTCAVVFKSIIPANTNQALAIIRGTNQALLSDYLRYCMSSDLLTFATAKARGGAMNNISLEDVSNFILPLPSLAEQKRIVAKVAELMALCDELAAQITIASNTRRQLLEATIHVALNGAV